MKRSRFIIYSLAFALPLFAGEARAAGSRSATHPNVILVLADDLGYGDLSCYGARKISTPAIDGLAAGGIRFTDAHSPASVCSPTRYAMLTGRYCWRTSLKERVLPPQAPLHIERGRMTLGALFQSQGYKTACIGKWHLGFQEEAPVDWNRPLRPGVNECGFDYYYGIPTSNNWPPFIFVENDQVVGRKPGEKIILGPKRNNPAVHSEVLETIEATFKGPELAEKLTDKAVRFIKDNRAHPFFLYYATPHVHLPTTPGKRFQETSQAGDYGDFAQEFDWIVAQLVETLRMNGLYENTLIIVTSDNGANRNPSKRYGHSANGDLRGGKAQIYEGGHRVPFIVHWPARVPGGTVSDVPFCLTDLLASFAALFGEELPANAGEDSINVLPALLGQPVDRSECPIVHHSSLGLFALRLGDWVYVDGAGPGGFLHELAPGENLRKMPQQQLYNLKTDPGQMENVYKENPERVARMKKLLEKIKAEGHSR
jgi:arylsulfatase A-like enzyme